MRGGFFPTTHLPNEPVGREPGAKRDSTNQAMSTAATKPPDVKSEYMAASPANSSMDVALVAGAMVARADGMALQTVDCVSSKSAEREVRSHRACRKSSVSQGTALQQRRPSSLSHWEAPRFAFSGAAQMRFQ